MTLDKLRHRHKEKELIRIIHLARDSASGSELEGISDRDDLAHVLHYCVRMLREADNDLSWRQPFLFFFTRSKNPAYYHRLRVFDEDGIGCLRKAIPADKFSKLEGDFLRGSDLPPL